MAAWLYGITRVLHKIRDGHGADGNDQHDGARHSVLRPLPGVPRLPGVKREVAKV